MNLFKLDSKTVLVVIVIVILGFLIDQISKQIVVKTMKIGESKKLVGNLVKITYIRNHAGPLGSMKNKVWLVNLIFGLIVLINILLVGFADINENPIYTIGISFMLAGNIGNLFCKLFRDGVVDFIDVGFSIPNIADFMILGGILFVGVSGFL